MGYTHYWYRQKEITPDTYAKIVADFKRLLTPMANLGVHLAGGLGEGGPVISEDEVRFNGPQNCGHAHRGDTGIAWPADAAGSIAGAHDNVKAGNWFGGALLSKRSCDGDCSHETFHFPMILPSASWRESEPNGLYFDCCKTAFKPYDLAVTAFLVIAKHCLGSDLIVRSDGEEHH